jgi:hypothetical protein
MEADRPGDPSCDVRARNATMLYSSIVYSSPSTCLQYFRVCSYVRFEQYVVQRISAAKKANFGVPSVM